MNQLVEKIERTRSEHIKALEELAAYLEGILVGYLQTDYFLDRLSRRYYNEDGYTRYIDYRDDPNWFMNPRVKINDELLIEVRVCKEYDIDLLYFEGISLLEYLTDKFFKEYGQWIIFK